MELILNVYDQNDEITKTYLAESYSIKMRTLKNIIDTLGIDSLSSLLTSNSVESNAELVKILIRKLEGSYDLVKDLLKDIFKELTDEEFLDTKLEEVVQVLINMMKNTVFTIALGRSKKN